MKQMVVVATMVMNGDDDKDDVYLNNFQKPLLQPKPRRNWPPQAT